MLPANYAILVGVRSREKKRAGPDITITGSGAQLSDLNHLSAKIVSVDLGIDETTTHSESPTIRKQQRCCAPTSGVRRRLPRVRPQSLASCRLLPAMCFYGLLLMNGCWEEDPIH